MKTKVILKYITLRFIFPLFLLQSCSNFVSVDAPESMVDSRDLFARKEGFEAAMAGIYQQLLAVNLGLTNGGLCLYMSLASDDIRPTGTTNAYQTFYQNSLLSSNTTVNNFWSHAYRGIYRANTILEHLATTEVLSEQDRNNYTGQCLFIRAFFYYYLAELFGDVPLVLSTDYEQNAAKERDSYTKVNEQIRDDLEIAVDLMPEAETKGRAAPNKMAALMLLSRVFLNMGDYLGAKNSAGLIILSQDYIDIESDMTQVFKIASKETIWQLSKENGNAAIATSFIPSSPTRLPLFVLSNELYASFDHEDERRIKWISKNTVSGVDYFYPFKYQARVLAPIEEYYVVFRLAEAYLIRAEALAHLKEYAPATEDVNKIRNRAGLQPWTYTSQEELHKEIAKQKRLEYFAEWGHRWLDLKRKDKIDSVLNAVKPSWETHSRLLPIPHQEVLRNVFLTQNQGYDE